MTDAKPSSDVSALLRTPLYDLHVSLGARMVAFAGYAMPVQYKDGILAEHRWTREKAGLFDVSHMGQARLRGDDPAAALERLTPGDLVGLDAGRQRYTLLLNDQGGIKDDLMVSRPDADGLFLVVNAATKAHDFAHIEAMLGDEAPLTRLDNRALLALQGPSAGAVMASFAPGAADMIFMDSRRITMLGVDCIVSRSGYTGEDGFEISAPASAAAPLAKGLLAHPDVRPIGLGARDSLRLEAGLCLYGHDIDETTSPIEAALGWAVPKVRRERADFPGAERILREIAQGPARLRAGFVVADKTPAREGAEIVVNDGVVGRITSGGFGPTLGRPVAMGYVQPSLALPGTMVELMVRASPRPAEAARLPFTPHRYKKT